MDDDLRVAQNGWKNPSKMDNGTGYPPFLETCGLRFWTKEMGMS